MKRLTQRWRTWNHSRKFVKVGKGCRFTAKYLHVDGHVEVGDYCKFRDFLVLRTHGDGKIIFNNRSGTSFYVVMEAAELIEIGEYTAIAEHSVLRDSYHIVRGTKEHWRVTPLHVAPIIIGPNCLIGSHVYIGPGVVLGEGAVIGQGSVVTKSVGSYEIWHGNPARKIGHRTEGVNPSLLRRDAALLESYGFKDDRYKTSEDEG